MRKWTAAIKYNDSTIMPVLSFLFRFIYLIWPLLLLAIVLITITRPIPWTSRGNRLLGASAVMWLVLTGFLLLEGGEINSQPSLLPEPWNSTLFIAVGFILLCILLILLLVFVYRTIRRRQIEGDLQSLQETDPTDFETIVAGLFESQGYRVRHLGQSGDHGVDLAVYTQREGKWIVQCKRYRTRAVGEGTVRDLYGAMHHEHAERGFLVTSGTISEPARIWADGKEMVLIDGENLVNLLKYKNSRMLTRYLRG